MNKKLLRQVRKAASTVNPVMANHIMYYSLMKKRLHLRKPETLNEKINWLKLNVFPENSLVIQCTDKVAVCGYIKGKGYGHLLNECYGIWDSASDIDWNTLPKQFVLKCNHGCGYNIICTDKSIIDISKTVHQLNDWMDEDFGKVTCEPHYSKIPRKILCEKYLENDIVDYKFFCFHGEPKFFYISQNPAGDFRKGCYACFNLDGTLAPFQRTDHPLFEVVPAMPAQLPEMIHIAAELSADFPFVRVDLFDVSGKIYFSELTFTPCSGMMPLTPESADYELGTLLDLNRYRR